MGMATMCEIMARMSRGIVTAQDSVSKAVTAKFITVEAFLDREDSEGSMSIPLGPLG